MVIRTWMFELNLIPKWSYLKIYLEYWTQILDLFMWMTGEYMVNIWRKSKTKLYEQPQILVDLRFSDYTKNF